MCKSNLEEAILSLSEPYTEEINLILTVPSFKNIFSAITVISEIGVNMDVFPTAKHLYSWAGLTPPNNESARKKKEPYNAKLYKKTDVLPINREITIEQAIIIARRQSFFVKVNA